MPLNLTDTSDSQLPSFRKCIGSAAHPHLRSENPAATMGTAIHKHLEQRAKIGTKEAFRRLQTTLAKYNLSEIDAAIATARCRNFEFEPPPRSVAEVALAWHILDEEAEVVTVEGGQGKYTLPEGVYAPGTIDLIFSRPEPLDLSGPVPVCPEGSTLWVVDYKTGSDVWVDAIEKNAQLLSGAAKAAYWTGATSVVPAILYVEKGEGTWDVFDKPMDQDAIDQAMWGTFDLHERIARARETRPLPGEYLEGYHCQYCPALAYCPIKAQRLRTLLEYPINRKEGPFTDDELSRMTAMLPVVKSLAKWIEETAKAAVAERGPIDVGSGRKYGPRPKQRDHLDPAVMLPIIEQVLESREDALHACKISKSQIGETIKSVHERLGIKRKAAQTMRQILAMGYEQEGIYKVPYEEWGIYVPEETQEEDDA